MSESVREKASQSLALVEEVTAMVLPEPAHANAVVPLEQADKPLGDEIKARIEAWLAEGRPHIGLGINKVDRGIHLELRAYGDVDLKTFISVIQRHANIYPNQPHR